MGVDPRPCGSRLRSQWTAGLGLRFYLPGFLFGPSVFVPHIGYIWLKIKQEGLRRFWSMFPLTSVPFWFRFSEPQPYIIEQTVFMVVSTLRQGSREETFFKHPHIIHIKPKGLIDPGFAGVSHFRRTPCLGNPRLIRQEAHFQLATVSVKR